MELGKLSIPPILLHSDRYSSLSLLLRLRAAARLPSNELQGSYSVQESSPSLSHGNTTPRLFALGRCIILFHGAILQRPHFLHPLHCLLRDLGQYHVLRQSRVAVLRKTTKEVCGCIFPYQNPTCPLRRPFVFSFAACFRGRSRA